MILALYDIRGIQNFIFSTNKLKENIGGSLLIQYLLEHEFKEILKKELGDNYIGIADVQDLNNTRAEAISVYIAGGNALILFKDVGIEHEITKLLSKHILEKTGNELTLMVAKINTEMKSISKDIEQLHRCMEQNKAKYVQSFPQKGIGITRLEIQTDLPIQCFKNEKNYSYPSLVKRHYEKTKLKDYYERLLIQENGGIEEDKKWKFPRNLDNLSFFTGKHHIALVHLDGNNIGKLIKELINEENDYLEGLKRYSQFSEELKKIINNSMKKTIADLINNLDTLKQKKIIDGDDEEKNGKKSKNLLPIRPIIMSGDDITFICHGELGLGLAENLIKNVDTERQKNDYHMELLKNSLSLSGGVLITNYKFPFARAYPILEDLARSAKLKGRILTSRSNKPDSWIDFQIINSGISSKLDIMRKNTYNCLGCNQAERLIGNGNIQMTQYNLLYRPWVLLGETHNENNQFEKIKELSKQLKKWWPRSQIKNLQKSFFISKDKVRKVILENQRRDRILDDSGDLKSGKWTQTPYFDAIEIIEYYNKINEV